MAEWTTVAGSGDVEEGGLQQVDIRGEPVVIARRDGDLFAFEGYCTHEECPLWEGEFVEHRIECYCHGSFFDIRTGEALVGPALVSLETYAVREQDGEIQVEA
jgi:3-phenylpropionate/trans-cinnamate dioxygenase ferredoxin component